MASSPDCRLLLALLASLALHGVLVAQRIRQAPAKSRPPLLARLAPPPPRVPAAPVEPEKPLPRALGRPDRPKIRPAAQEPHEEPKPAEAAPIPQAERPSRAAPREVVPEGRDLAASALASVGRVSRDMSRQEGRLNPLRGTSPKEETVKVRNAIAEALEKQFGHPVPFTVETLEKGDDGSMVRRVRTEKGVSCFKTLPDNVLLSAPGQGTKGAMMFPTPC